MEQNGRMVEDARQYATQAREYATQHPWTAIAVAVGAGVALGMAAGSGGRSARSMLKASTTYRAYKNKRGSRDSNVMVGSPTGGLVGPFHRGASMTGQGPGLP